MFAGAQDRNLRKEVGKAYVPTSMALSALSEQRIFRDLMSLKADMVNNDDRDVP